MKPQTVLVVDLSAMAAWSGRRMEQLIMFQHLFTVVVLGAVGLMLAPAGAVCDTICIPTVSTRATTTGGRTTIRLQLIHGGQEILM